MWQAWLFLFIGFIVMFGMTSILQPKLPTPSSSFRSIVYKKREKMNFPSNHLSTSLITPDNSPYSSHPSTPSNVSHRNSPIPYSAVNSPIRVSNITCRRSIFSHELSNTTSDLFDHGR